MESLIYGLETHGRSLTAQNDSDEIRFFIGTQIINSNNQIHMVELLEESNRLSTKIFNHNQGEIWSLSSSSNQSLLASVYTSTNRQKLVMQTAVLRIPEPELLDPSKEVLDFAEIEVLDTEKHGSDIKCTEFHPSSTDQLASVVDGKILLFNRTESKSVVVAEMAGKKFSGGGMFSGANQFVSMHENTIKGYDIRDANHVSWNVESTSTVRSIDVNPNKAFHVATGSEDGVLRIFDVRNSKEGPVFSSGFIHQHWIFSVSFNKFHDQLLLSSSSDGKVLLSCAAACSSEATSPTHDDEVKKNRMKDGLLETFSEHEDSVYCVTWSSADPWTFASLSYDGRLVINKINKKYKYQIIL